MVKCSVPWKFLFYALQECKPFVKQWQGRTCFVCLSTESNTGFEYIYVNMYQANLLLIYPRIVDYSVEIPTRCSFVIEFIIPKFFKGSTPLIIRSSKLYLQPLVHMPIWWPAVSKAEWAQCPLSLGNGRSPYGHINQRLQIQFRAPDDERRAARNVLSLQ